MTGAGGLNCYGMVLTRVAPKIVFKVGVYDRIVNSAKEWAIIDIRNPELLHKTPSVVNNHRGATDHYTPITCGLWYSHNALL